jgi:hypothetical protein
MEVGFVFYQEDDTFKGWLDDYPAYRFQSPTLEDLKDHLRELFIDKTGGRISDFRLTGKLVIH